MKPTQRAGTSLAAGVPIMRTTLSWMMPMVAAALWFVVPSAAGAAGSVDGTVIVRTAEATVRAHAGVSPDTLHLQVGPLDPRLRLAACSRPLTGFITGDGRLHYQTAIGVRCEGAVRWTIYVSVTVQSRGRVLVARRDLRRGALLGAGDFAARVRLVHGLLSDYVRRAALLPGESLRQPVRVGEPLSLQALAPVALIQRGQRVELVATSGPLEVRMAGIALSDGQLSQLIQVRNLSSQRVVQGFVRSDHVVQTP